MNRSHVILEESVGELDRPLLTYVRREDGLVEIEFLDTEIVIEHAAIKGLQKGGASHG